MILGLIEAVVLSLLYSIIEGLGLIDAITLSEALSEALLLRDTMRDADGVTDVEGETIEHVKHPSV